MKTSGYAELHRHLDGSLRPDTLRELAREQRVELPKDIRFYPGMGLSEALSRFAITLSVLQRPRAVQRIASEMCEDAAREGISTLEIRFAPQLHTSAPLPAIVDAALDGIAGRAGLILCALYGDSPELVQQLVDVGAARPGVVGIDLAGGPAPHHTVGMADYAPAFGRARSLGLGRTVHAGEGRPPGEIRVAIEQLHAQRIGHGTTLLEDPAVLALICDRQVTIEACPTSNVHTGVIAQVDDHPIHRWLTLGVRVCVCTDNTLLSDVDSPTEHARVRAIPGMSDAHLEQLIAFGHEAAFR